MKPKFSWNEGVMIVFAVVFVTLFAFTAGMEAQEGKVVESVTSLILGLFFFAIFGAIIADKFSNFNRAVEMARLDEKSKALEAMAAQTKLMQEAQTIISNFMDEQRDRAHDERLAHALDVATARVLGMTSRQPKVTELKKIESEFHKIVEDHWVKITPVGNDLHVQFSDQDPAPAKKKAPVKTSAAKKALDQMPKPAKKKVTAKKGNK